MNLSRIARHVAILMLGLSAVSAQAAEQFRIAWTLYPAYMPWEYAQGSGILEKWAKKYGIEIEAVQVNDYVEAINQYTTGDFDACMMATMDALTIPAAAGTDSTVLAIADYSNGNDVIIVKNGKSLEDLRGEKVNLIEYSISHYFLARALQSVGMSERDVTLVNTSDADMAALFAQPSVSAMVTWNPMASKILESKDAVNVFDSRKMPSELTDSIVVNSKTLERHPALGKALVGAWFETLAVMQKDDEEGRKAREIMGLAAGTDRAGYEAQLQATHLYDDPGEVVALMADRRLQDTMASIADFSFENGLFGSGAQSSETIGLAYPAGAIRGDHNNIKLRFDDTYARLAADGEL
ncbi:putative urea ABC transporter substrate-binding protein [Pseudomonas lopnurensis]|uniref:putative urea ABC transporter substrate-binding protein n=1 Tax=Pseudomonas lopnurensis TaxID=1477517 RepID=UPI001879C534|nr:putative urea ABC transporter substrate-binding protein [Pseudomonas lopnurensis]MBE7374956.1 ABC transporter substrate-binding protein [Pseudomonas lopnurensis]